MTHPGPTDVFTFTVVDKEKPELFRLLRSAKKWGWDLKVYFGPVPGSDEVPFWHWNPYIFKKHAYQEEALKDAWKRGYNRFFFLDGLDTIFTGPPEEVQWRDELHFSTEMNCWPDYRYRDYFPEGRSLNTGVMWGEISKCLDRMPKGLVPNQLSWQREYLRFPKGIWLDTYCRVAVERAYHYDDPSWLGWNNGRLWVPSFHTTPVVLHCNGGGMFPPWLKDGRLDE